MSFLQNKSFQAAKLLGFRLSVVCATLLFMTSCGSDNEARQVEPVLMVEPIVENVTKGVCNITFPETSDLLKDEELRWKGDNPESVPVYHFSQSQPEFIDPQLDEMGTGTSLRTTNQWRNSGTEVEHYDIEGIQRLKDQGKRVILGLTASVIFENQFAAKEDFLEVVSRDALNNPVRHDEIVNNAYRGNVASKAFRDLIVKYARTLIDVGADGIFLDEFNSGYRGGEDSNFDGNEGFDDIHEADFRRYLCKKYPDLDDDGFVKLLGTTADNALSCSDDLCKSNFSMRKYFENNGGYNKNLPLMAEWGDGNNTRTVPSPDTFAETANIVYWAETIRRIRKYARNKYNREILITSNGLLPFVDFQSVGLFDWNPEGPGGGNPFYMNYVPTDAQLNLDASYSFLNVFSTLRQISDAISGPVPTVLFIDWPTQMSENYYNFSVQEKKDYFRLYAAEAYASNLRFAWHLKTSISTELSAQESGMLDWFVQEAAFYRNNAALYLDVSDSDVQVDVSIQNVAVKVNEKTDGTLVVHLINHNYSSGLESQLELDVTINGVFAATEATIISPDNSSIISVPLTVIEGRTQLVLPELQGIAIITLK